jgi:uncharacterized phage protein gp47/JayE
VGQTPVLRITEAGAAKPTLAECLAYVQGVYRSIYGQDTYLGNDSQDGQFVALLAQALDDVNGAALSTYNGYSPSSAQGAGLSSIVKNVGIRRKIPTYSTDDFLHVGRAFTTVTGGLVTDPAGYQWAFPTFTIPETGQILVTGTCTTIGAIALAAGAVDTVNGKGAIATVQNGWQSAMNPSAAALGAPVESDSQLRQRQAASVALPSQTLLGGLVGALYAVSGVTRLRAYENDTNQPDANKIPGKGISIVVDGGDANVIAALISLKKGAAGTYGSTVVSVTDDVGISRNINFFRPMQVPISYHIVIKPLVGYTAAVEAQIQQALASWTTDLGIGNGILLSRAYAPADLSDQPTGSTFEIVPNQLTVARDGHVPTGNDVPIAFNEAPICVPASVTIVYVSQ